MEHKIVLGGEHYVPLARSELKRLRAAGLLYATKTLILDDAQVVVRVNGNHDFIRIESSDGSIYMDSGVFDVPFAKYQDIFLPVSFLPGRPVVSSPREEYGNSFVAGTNAKKKNSADKLKQMLGLISDAPPQGTEFVEFPQHSFLPGVTKDAQGKTSYLPEDSALASKKEMVRKCPPGIFTGKCRLYVQALYGSPIYAIGKDGSPVPDAPPEGDVTLGTGTPPSIKVKATNSTDTVSLWTESGVYLNPKNGQHFLLQPEVGASNGRVTVYPLKGSKYAESKRKLLVSGLLGTEETEKLEAYILSTCRPVLKDAVVLPVGAIPDGEPIGYGFHWNWEGTAADIVVHRSVLQSSEAGQERLRMEANHVRILMEFQENGKPKSAKIVIVEAAKPWAVSRVHWCITGPRWRSDGSVYQSKFTPKFSNLFTCDAPLYAFYNRNELKVARATVVVSERPGTITTTSQYWDMGFGVRKVTGGFLGGFSSVKTQPSADVSAFFSCGSIRIGPIKSNELTTDVREDISAKSFTGVLSWGASEPTYANFSPEGPRRIYFGFPTNPLVSSTEYTDYVEQVSLSEVTNYEVSFTYEEHTVLEQTTGLAEIIVPSYESEAMFVHGGNRVETTNVSSSKKRHTSIAFVNNEFWRGAEIPPLQVGYLRFKYTPYSASIVNGSQDITPSSNQVSTLSSDSGGFFCSAGAVDAFIPARDDFHDNDKDEVSASYRVNVSAGSKPVVFADGYIKSPTNITEQPGNPVFVGWV